MSLWSTSTREISYACCAAWKCPLDGPHKLTTLKTTLYFCSQAHLNHPMRVEVSVCLPPEQNFLEKLMMTQYGCWDARQNLELTTCETATDAGCARGEINSCCYRHDERQNPRPTSLKLLSSARCPAVPSTLMNSRKTDTHKTAHTLRFKLNLRLRRLHLGVTDIFSSSFAIF